MRKVFLFSLLLALYLATSVRADMPSPAPVVEVGEVLAVQDTRSHRYTGRVV